MAFTVQDDQGSVADANSYVTVAFYKAYHTDRNVGQVINVLNSDTEIQAALVLATDFLDSRYSFVGQRRTQDQTTEWPRYDALDVNDYVVTGIPKAIQEACAELALAELLTAGSLFPVVATDTSGLDVKRTKKKLDVLEEETEYFGTGGGTSAKTPIFHTADWRLKRSGLLRARNRIVRSG